MNTVNKLMDILPEDPENWTNEHIEEIIAWQKKMYWDSTKSTNGRKKKAQTPEETSSLLEEALKDLMKPAPTVKFKRRV